MLDIIVHLVEVHFGSLSISNHWFGNSREDSSSSMRVELQAFLVPKRAMVANATLAMKGKNLVLSIGPPLAKLL